MATTRLTAAAASATAADEQALGAFLRDRRARLDPAALGFPVGRRRTPGLRREAVPRRRVPRRRRTGRRDARGGGAGGRPLAREPRLRSAFVVDGRPDLGLVIFSPATPDDARRIRALPSPESP